MANLKISGLNTETNLSNVLGLAGYNAGGTIKISGADIINSVGSAINTLYTSNGTLSADRVVNANNNQCNFNNVRGMQITSNGSPINGVIFDVRNNGGGSILAIGDTNDNVLITGGASIGLTFEPSSALEVRSTTQGFLKPVMTGAQVEGISTPATGLEAYATSAGAGDVTGAGWWGYNGSNWVQINGGGSTPTLQDVVNASAPLPLIDDQGGNTSWIEFREGNTTNRLTIGRDGGTGPFGIACSQGTFTIKGATFQPFTIQTGPSSARAIIFQYPTSGNSVVEFTNQMDIRLSSSSAFKCGPSNTPGTAGQVLTSTGTSVEWTSPSPEVTTYIGQQGSDVEFYTDSFITIKWDETNNDIELRVNDWGTASSLNAMDRQDGLSSVEPDNTNIPSSTGTTVFTPISPILGVNERAEILVAPVDFPWPTDSGSTNWPTYKIEVMNNGTATSTNFYAIITKYSN